MRAATATDEGAKRGPVSGGGTFAEAAGVLRRLNDADLIQVNEKIIEQLASSAPIIPALATHLLGSGGKRLRPLLTLSAARLFDYRGARHVELAAAVELIHAATLLHDDVVDGSRLRRGLATANVLWGDKESVLVGDFLFSRAFELMVAAQNLRVLGILSHASSVIAEGEVLQLATQKNVGATYEMYLAVVESKTAALFAAATQAGAAVAGAPAAAEECMRRFGRNLGIAFQLVDDALDYAGYEAALGKNVGDDFREGKMTLPVVYAIDRATAAERTFWRRTIADGDQRDGDFEEARDILVRNHAIADTLACARRYADRAIGDLDAAPRNAHRDALAGLAEMSAARTH